VTASTAGRSERPLVSIGVPVYNGERFLGRALDSLLAQTLADFELIISDNASTDSTQAICEEYRRRDGRIRYLRQPVNIGAPRNWNAVVHAARGVFFKWASASDYCAPAMLEKCVAAMGADPRIVLCHGLTQLVDEREQPLEVYGGDVVFNQERPSDRFLSVAMLMALNNAQSGVIRLDVLRRTRLDRMYPSGDMALMAELALYGTFYVVPEVMLYRRQSTGTFTAKMAPLALQRIYNPRARRAMTLLRARRHIDNLVSITRAPLPLGEKLRAYRVEVRLARWDRDRLWSEFVMLLRGGRRER
jgi:glycosyltransferase involved in cell wall biosynthesis